MYFYSVFFTVPRKLVYINFAIKMLLWFVLSHFQILFSIVNDFCNRSNFYFCVIVLEDLYLVEKFMSIKFCHLEKKIMLIHFWVIVIYMYLSWSCFFFLKIAFHLGWKASVFISFWKLSGFHYCFVLDLSMNHFVNFFFLFNFDFYVFL